MITRRMPFVQKNLLPPHRFGTGAKPDPKELDIDTDVRYFAVLTPGHTGSVWLTKLFNMHPEVLCWHEGVLQRIFPRRFWTVTDQDCLEWFYSIKHLAGNHYRKIFSAVGDIGSFLNPDMAGDEIIQKHFSIYGLIRNGVLFVRSQAHALEQFEKLPPQLAKQVETYNKHAAKCFPQLARKHDNKHSAAFFIYSCWRWRIYIEAVEKYAIKTFRIEDISSYQSVNALFAEVTNMPAPAKQAILPLLGTRVNPHVSPDKSHDPDEILNNSWRKYQREVFRIICDEKMAAWYNRRQGT